MNKNKMAFTGGGRNMYSFENAYLPQGGILWSQSTVLSAVDCG